MTVHWADLDAASAPRPRGDVAQVRADDELVLYDPSAGRAHVLNPTAATVWAVLDGEVDVATLSEEVSETFGVELDAVTEQLVTLARELGRLGLLADVQGWAAITEEGCP